MEAKRVGWVKRHR